MIKVAVLDDYQNIFREFIDIDKHKDKYDFTIFNQPFANKDEALAANRRNYYLGPPCP